MKHVRTYTFRCTWCRSEVSVEAHGLAIEGGIRHKCPACEEYAVLTPDPVAVDSDAWTGCHDCMKWHGKHRAEECPECGGEVLRLSTAAEACNAGIK